MHTAPDLMAQTAHNAPTTSERRKHSTLGPKAADKATTHHPKHKCSTGISHCTSLALIIICSPQVYPPPVHVDGCQHVTGGGEGQPHRCCRHAPAVQRVAGYHVPHAHGEVHGCGEKQAAVGAEIDGRDSIRVAAEATDETRGHRVKHSDAVIVTGDGCQAW